MTPAELRRMLELAAKAAGPSVQMGYFGSGRCWVQPDEVLGGFKPWRPHADDGDSRRLEVKLQIDVKQYGDFVVAWFDGGFIGTGRILYDCDPYAATRLAVLRAAVAIGEAMP